MARNVDPRVLLEIENTIRELNTELDMLEEELRDPSLTSEEQNDIRANIAEVTSELVEWENEKLELEFADNEPVYDTELFDDDEGY